MSSRSSAGGSSREVDRTATTLPRVFWIYLAGQSISLSGTWVHHVALGALVVDLTGSARALASVSLAGALPVVGLALAGGALADRLDRRRLAITTQALLALAAAAHALLVGAGVVTLTHLHLLAIATGLVTAFDAPAQRALLGWLAPGPAITRAVAFTQLTHHATRLVGPALAAGMLAAGWLGTHPRASLAALFAANAASYAAALLALAAIGRSAAPAAARRADTSTLGCTLRLVARTPSLRRPLVTVAVLATCVLPLLVVLMPLVVRARLHGGAATLGVMTASSGLGALVGALALVRRGGRASRRGEARILLVCAAGSAGLTLVTHARGDAHMPTLCAALSVVVAAGSLSLALGLSTAALQEATPDAQRGRVLALHALLMAAGTPVGGFAWAALADAVGLETALGLMALGPALLALARAGRGAGHSA